MRAPTPRGLFTEVNMYVNQGRFVWTNQILHWLSSTLSSNVGGSSADVCLLSPFLPLSLSLDYLRDNSLQPDYVGRAASRLVDHPRNPRLREDLYPLIFSFSRPLMSFAAACWFPALPSIDLLLQRSTSLYTLSRDTCVCIQRTLVFNESKFI